MFTRSNMKLSAKYILLLFALCIFAPVPAALAKIIVFVSIVPQQYFLKQIGGELLQVEVMVPPGASPATYEPKPRQMAALARAKAYFAIGVPFEKAWIQKIASANGNLAIVQTDENIPKRPLATHIHSHGKPSGDPGGDAIRGIPDPHIWLSPSLVVIQAQTILQALQQIDPAHQDVYAANHKLWMERLARLDRQLQSLFQGRKGHGFMVFHPAWGYFADAYGLVQMPVEIEGKAPKPAQLRQLIDHARRHHIRVVFVQPQFSAKSAAQIAKEIGGAVVPADPLAPDWATNLMEIAEKFLAAAKESIQ